MNAQALRKFVEENQRLVSECAHLMTQCNKWERECSLYDHDLEALMDFGNEADQRAKEAKIRDQELEDEVRKLRDELALFKYKMEMNSALEKDKEHLMINLHMADEEVKLLFEENKVLDVENKRLLRLYQKERNHSASGGKHTDSASAKSNKRKSSSKTSSLIQGKIDLVSKKQQDSPYHPCAPKDVWILEKRGAVVVPPGSPGSHE
ncbi:hypothetical protein DVH24_042591 [Malus domestica]|uniref:Uncharacterized protein n=1 Tax=Malus domestica TaxID=3750 RepID=A0A498JDC2_MALDO|nr:hypothetical protein DVH24_042591 [Malus domestica]